MIAINPKAKEPIVLVAYKVKVSDRWECIKVKGQGGDKKQITLWPVNIPTGIEEGDAFLVTSIDSFKYSSRKDNSGTWRDDISLNVSVERLGVAPDAARQPKTSSYEGRAPQWSPPPKAPDTPLFVELSADDEGLPF